MSNTDFQSKRKQNQDHPQSNHHAKHNKRLRKDVRATPWRDMWELEAVGRALISVTRQPNIPNNEFSENTMTIEQALETVAVWRARSDALGGLSHAVECTAALSQVHWRDMSQQGSFLVSATELRLAYSAAIIRCINGFADMLQQQRFMAAPVSTLCGQLGIASWLVDIRHESSHNALPTLGELRLGATTLLDFLKSEYWIPTCPNWEPGNDEHDVQKQLQQKPTHYLLQYKSCATSASSSSAESAPKSTDINSAGSTKRKPKKSKPATITRPIDMFFGDVGDSSSSSDDDDWDPILGSVWGSSVGTSNNRFALLQSTTKKKEKKTKSSQNQQKKKLGEKYPIDYAKDFVRAVAPQEGLSTALTFLVWGGVGTSPSGRGVLIPGSAAAFPASEQGIMKCWQRYSPLIQVLGRTWPGFCPALLVHLVDFVLSIEDGVVEQSTVDAGSARKLYFLSAWIRLLLSQLFVAKLDSTFVSKKASKTKGTKTTELELAELSWLQKLQYPCKSRYHSAETLHYGDRWWRSVSLTRCLLILS